MGFLIQKKSKIHGIGIFTNKVINKGDEFYIVPIKLIFNRPTPKCAYIGGKRWVSDEKVLNFVNHSCNANAVLDILGEPKLIAKRKIRSGEEITVDYDKTELNGEKVVCNCKGNNCRKYFLSINNWIN